MQRLTVSEVAIDVWRHAVYGTPTGPALWRDVIAQLDDGRCLAFEMVIEGGKHFVPEDHPDEVTAAINHVLVE